jgi:uncharacterized protein
LTFDDFVYFVAGDVDTFWSGLYAQIGQQYSSPTVEVVYEPIAVENAPNCQRESGGIYDPSNDGPGPIYCFENSTMYIPANWRVPTTNLLMDEHGDFALATIIAHEWGHHLQKPLMASGQTYPSDDSQELQADCLAGVWANSTYYDGQLEPGDFQEALDVLKTIGDDTFGVPDQEGTHGDAREREAWFRYGYDTGDGSRCVVQ